MHIHINCWKHYNARPQDKEVNYKGQYAAYIEGFDGYLYSLTWAKFLIEKLKDEEEFNLVK